MIAQNNCKKLDLQMWQGKMSYEMPFKVLNAFLSFSTSASSCINMHRPIIDTLKQNLDQGFKTPGVMIEKTETQSTANLHYPLNLEHKLLQDVYRVTQSEPIRASYRPVEFALFKKTWERTWGSWGLRGDSKGGCGETEKEREMGDLCVWSTHWEDICDFVIGFSKLWCKCCYVD